MSWQDIRQRMLLRIGGILPHDTSPYGAVEGRKPPSTIPHRGVDFNYDVGPDGQRGVNLTHPALRSPVAGVVENAGEGNYGRIAIRDNNGFLHEILHTQNRHVSIGDPVAAGQLIGTMGNTGTRDQHVHYQLRDPAGNVIDPTAFWDRQGPVDPNPSPPALLGEYQQYLHGPGGNTGYGFDGAPDATATPDFSSIGEPFWALQATPSRGPAPGNAAENTRRLGQRIAAKPMARRPPVPFVASNDVLSSGQADSFGARFGNWISSPAGIAPRDQPELGPQVSGPLGILSGKPMPNYAVPPPLGGLRNDSGNDDENWYTRWRRLIGSE